MTLAGVEVCASRGARCLERTFLRGLADPWGGALPDDPRTWSDDELRAALYDETLRHAVQRLAARLRRRDGRAWGGSSADARDERLAAWAVIRLDADRDELAWRARGFGPRCIRYRFGLACECSECEIPF